MLSKHIKWWSLLYAIFFVFLSFLAEENNFDNNYPKLFLLLSLIAYLLMNVGNFCYAFSISLGSFKKYWRFIAPAFIVYIVAGVFIDQFFGKNAGTTDLATDIFIWLLVILVCLPTFLANLKLAGYLKSNK